MVENTKIAELRNRISKARVNKVQKLAENVKAWNPETDGLDSLLMILEDYFSAVDVMCYAGNEICLGYVDIITDIKSAQKYAGIADEIIESQKQKFKPEEQHRAFCIIDSNGLAISGDAYFKYEEIVEKAMIYVYDVESNYEDVM